MAFLSTSSCRITLTFPLWGTFILLYIYLFSFLCPNALTSSAHRGFTEVVPHSSLQKKKRMPKRSCRGLAATGETRGKSFGAAISLAQKHAGVKYSRTHARTPTPVACFTFSRCITEPSFVCQAVPLFTSSPSSTSTWAFECHLSSPRNLVSATS